MFPGPTLQAALTQVIETALNQALALDPAGRDALLAALGTAVRFEFSGLNLGLTLSSAGERVQVASQDTGLPLSFALQGPPLAYLALAMGDTGVFKQGRLHVQGDTGQAHDFQRALQQLNPDWEAALARRIGDIPAHLIGQRLRSAGHWSRHAFTSLNSNVEEYIHEESRSLPGRHEVEARFQDIDALSLRSDRLQARIQRLEHLSNHQPDTPSSEQP